ncbi:RHS repeat-associated core domain-containing protein [Chitinophagaceae bacterium MMS25-I14]
MLEVKTQDPYGIDDNATSLKRFSYSNHLGSSTLELDENARTISYEEYHPYGTTAYQALNSDVKAVAKRYRYTGKERDEESGLYYHGARYYIPWLARWSAVDPKESQRPGLSPYDYCSNNPINRTDPDGKQEKEQEMYNGKPVQHGQRTDANGNIFNTVQGYNTETGKFDHFIREEMVTGVIIKASRKTPSEPSNQPANEPANDRQASHPHYGDIRTVADGTMQKFTLNGWETAKYARDWHAPESLIAALKAKEGLGDNVKVINGQTIAYPYLDPVKIPTVGYGHVIKSLKDPKFVKGLTLAEADKLLRADVAKEYEERVQKAARVPLTQSEFNTLLTSIYNGGVGDSVKNVVNNNNYNAVDVFKAFLQRRSAKGKELRGLIIRRAMEAWQYLYGEEPRLNNKESREWMNAWNNFADDVAPQPKIKQISNYK